MNGVPEAHTGKGEGDADRGMDETSRVAHVSRGGYVVEGQPVDAEPVANRRHRPPSHVAVVSGSIPRYQRTHVIAWLQRAAS